MWGDKGAAPPRGVRPSPRQTIKIMEKYLVDFRKIERFADNRVRINPTHTSQRYNDKMIDRLKSDLKMFGYKCVGRSKDEHGNSYTTYELYVPHVSAESCKVFSRVTIITLK